MNLFSVFDPNAIFGLPVNWISSSILILLMPRKFWATKGVPTSLLRKILLKIESEFQILLKTCPAPSLALLRLSFFLFIFLNNSLGLFPYVFTASSHLTFRLTLALACWIGIAVFNWVKTTQHALAHLVPLGSPLALRPFIVLIELTSSIIRPITLSVRLAANIVAGHLLITLISSPLSLRENLRLIMGIFSGLVLLTVLESAVAVIQAYVFRVLSCLYLREINAKKII